MGQPLRSGFGGRQSKVVVCGASIAIGWLLLLSIQAKIASDRSQGFGTQTGRAEQPLDWMQQHFGGGWLDYHVRFFPSHWQYRHRRLKS
ncbi:hypothetical protein, partial [Staphylococcus aureus]|uniref:hypothetical protein n=1 Tax=Staphylococcus aureus TaxID=1280 RepID=UPI0039BE175F